MTAVMAADRMRIALVCFSEAWGGLEIMVAKIADNLRRRGHNVTIVCPAGSPIAEESASLQLPSLLLNPRFGPLDVGAIGNLARHFRRNNIDIGLATLSKDIGLLALASRLAPATHIGYIQQMQFGHSKRDLVHRYTYSRLSLWITLTSSMKESVVRNTIVPADRIKVIPFGTNLHRFDPRRIRQAPSRRSFGFPTGVSVVGFIGRLDPQKGCEEFLRAAQRVLRKRRKTLFVMLGEETRGEPGYAEHLRQLSRQLELGDQIRFLPFTRDVPAFLSALDILAVPSHGETFGYVAVEGMAMGKPVIGTNAGGLPEIIVDRETGYLVPPKDPEELAEAILRLAGSRKLRERMGKEGRQRAVERFDFGKSVRALEKALQPFRGTP